MQLNWEVPNQALDIIIVSDIHLSFDNLDKLSKSVQASGAHYDYCLVGGDIAYCDHDTKEHDEQAMAQFTKDILTKLQDILQCKVLWIPGNHDPLFSLRGEQIPNEGIINIHRKEFVLEVGLTIVGLGGSIPAYSDLESKSQVWVGYPYKSEEEFNKDVDEVFKEDEVKSSKIFLTHVGPSASNTAVSRRGNNFIYAGSPSLNKLTDRSDLLLMIHGHVHNGGKYDLFKNKPIINPGALLDGQYAVLKLVRVQKIWSISRISFEKIV